MARWTCVPARSANIGARISSRKSCTTITTRLPGVLDSWFSSIAASGHLCPYLQRACGYSVTAVTSEKTNFLCLGPTDTGKSTFLGLFRELFEEYSTLILIDALMQRDEDNASRADLADLRGVRFAMTSETEEGQRLREGKLKRISQGQGRHQGRTQIRKSDRVCRNA